MLKALVKSTDKKHCLHSLGCGGLWALGTALAAKTGETASVETDRLYQALAIALQRENARSVLRWASESAGDAGHLVDP